MSKAAKQSIVILAVLLIGSLAFAGYIVFEKIKLEAAKVEVDGALEKSRRREKDRSKEIKNLKGALNNSEKEKTTLQGSITRVESQLNDVNTELKDVSDQRDTWKSRVDEISQERDRITKRVNGIQRTFNEYKIKEKERELKWEEKYSKTPTQAQTASGRRTPHQMAGASSGAGNEEYWASVLREKAGLEVELARLKSEISKDSTNIVDLKQKNADLQIELDAIGAELDVMGNDKFEIERTITDKEKLVNNLSLELARAKNDKKFVADRADRLSGENKELRHQLKRLFTSKSALEKKIVSLSQEKEKLATKLGQTEGLIQSKIDEIWEIKESIDETIKTTKTSSYDTVELPPIVVNSHNQARQFDQGIKDPGLSGKIVSINTDNNFVIVNVGEDAGVRAGDTLGVYRESEYIARLEVIQVRKNISAADLKDQWSQIHVGDIIR